MSTQVLRRRFSVHEYYLMAQAGILHEDDRVELIEGEVVEMAPIGSQHAACVRRLNQLVFRQVAHHQSIVSVQNPVRLGERSEPQPDIMLLRRRSDFYAGSHPGPEDVLLLVEVSDTSSGYDQEVKVPLYAGAGIVETWLVDLTEELIRVYRKPGPEGYREVRRVQRGEILAPETLPGLELLAEDILPTP